ncbi:MAG: M23 family metallopeptidase [Candidatus Obscuribacterales bacterium]|nr:M23 family metallopeptidase [Candidatus Obscuribacterales bacterium]
MKRADAAFQSLLLLSVFWSNLFVVCAGATAQPTLKLRPPIEEIHTAAPVRPGVPVIRPPAAANVPAHPATQSLPIVKTVTPKYSRLPLLDTKMQPFKPEAFLPVGDNLCFLGVNCVWIGKGNVKTLEKEQQISAERFGITGGDTIDSVPVQEFNNFVYYSPDNSLIVLDKAGDLFEFSLDTHKYKVFRANAPFILGAPDPDFIDLVSINNQVIVLDPERNNLWRIDGKTKKVEGLFKAVLPWRVKPGDIYIGDGICIVYDGSLYMLKNAGYITRYANVEAGRAAKQISTPCKRNVTCRPSRLATAYGAPLFVVERENNRVAAYDKITGKTKQYLFPRTSDLRSLYPVEMGFYIVDGDTLLLRKLNTQDAVSSKCEARQIDSRLTTLTMPIAGMRLPRHPGVYPGARRLYRYGVHAGLDFFNDPGAKVKINMGTPAIAAAAGKVIRADTKYKDMTEQQMNKVMRECLTTHHTSEHNEDLLRGCQVWIDHGNGLITRYAHLDKANPDLKVGQLISRGDFIGEIGVSGTGQNLPGRTKYPHLHFEIRLDGHYLGFGLTPQETIGVYEDIFGKI